MFFLNNIRGGGRLTPVPFNKVIVVNTSAVPLPKTLEIQYTSKANNIYLYTKGVKSKVIALKYKFGCRGRQLS